MVSNLQAMFSVPITEELFISDAETSLRTVAKCLISGGRVSHRPYLLRGGKLAEELRRATKVQVYLILC